MSHIRSVTEIPGPRSRAVLARRREAVPRGVFHSTPVVAAAAAGAIVEDVDGNRYIDFAGGIGTLAVGHSAPAVVAAIKRQLESFTHTCFSVAPYESYVSLAERLAKLAPGGFAKKTLLVNSGAEAVENALKIARHATGRPGVLCFEDAFHGRTLWTLSVTSKVHPYKAGFGPFVPDVWRVPYAYCYRCRYGCTYPSCGMACVDAIEDYFKRYADPATIGSVLVEPVLGEGGFVVPPPEFLPRLAALCSAHGILLVVDEVQTGFGRTGRMFACEHAGVEPDLLVMAKSLAGGLPLAAVVGRADVMDAPGTGGLGGTYAGNPLAVAAALAVIETFAQQDLLERAEAIGKRIERRAGRWQERHPLIGDVRRLGAMAAIELVVDRENRRPARDSVVRLVQQAYERGVLLIGAGTYGNVVRFLPPLVISDEELDEGLDVIEACVKSSA
jgi:4-aminobutyrate aminotransferase/(S)-3-amino-2-methylpropionate transaminase